MIFVTVLDYEEFLYLLNLKKDMRFKWRTADQGFLNAVYNWEKFDIGLHFNVRSGVVQVTG